MTEMPKVNIFKVAGGKEFCFDSVCKNEDRLAQLRHISETRLVDVIEIMKEGCFNVAMNELLCIKQEIDQELEGEK